MVAVLVAGCGLIRSTKLAVVAERQDIRVTNMLRTRSVGRSEIRAFTTPRGFRSPRRTLEIELLERMPVSCTLFDLRAIELDRTSNRLPLD
jgi:hypothetical protein